MGARRGAAPRRRWRSRRRSCTGRSTPRAAALPARNAARASPRTRCAWPSWCRYRVAGRGRAGGRADRSAPRRGQAGAPLPAPAAAVRSRSAGPPSAAAGAERSLFLAEAPWPAAARGLRCSAGPRGAAARRPPTPGAVGWELPPSAAGAVKAPGGEAVQSSPLSALAEDCRGGGVGSGALAEALCCPAGEREVGVEGEACCVARIFCALRSVCRLACFVPGPGRSGFGACFAYETEEPRPEARWRSCADQRFPLRFPLRHGELWGQRSGFGWQQ